MQFYSIQESTTGFLKPSEQDEATEDEGREVGWCIFTAFMKNQIILKWMKSSWWWKFVREEGGGGLKGEDPDRKWSEDGDRQERGVAAKKFEPRMEKFDSEAGTKKNSEKNGNARPDFLLPQWNDFRNN